MGFDYSALRFDRNQHKHAPLRPGRRSAELVKGTRKPLLSRSRAMASNPWWSRALFATELAPERRCGFRLLCSPLCSKALNLLVRNSRKVCGQPRLGLGFNSRADHPCTLQQDMVLFRLRSDSVLNTLAGGDRTHRRLTAPILDSGPLTKRTCKSVSLWVSKIMVV